jgi:hypothetical protein
MQKPIQKALLRKFLLDQCRKKNRTPLPLQAPSLTIAIPSTLQLQPRQIETPNSHPLNALVHERSLASRTYL